MFDPYQRWLRIPPGQRPVPAWQLLGITAAERNPRAMEEAALGQSAQVRTYQLAYPDESNRLLNEIAKALNESLAGRVVESANQAEMRATPARKEAPLLST
jgi:hypothetical protein